MFFVFFCCLFFHLHAALLTPLFPPSLCLSPPLIVRLWGIQGMGTFVDWQKAGKFKKTHPKSIQLNKGRGIQVAYADRQTDRPID
ncbi:hypothetical protein F5H01DRAFT_333269 [Linnemannia elongata]|nr:hypothetical protein F5H01DRAFT_333269 [Linnemannia elongata]